MASSTTVSELWHEAVSAYEEGLGQQSDLRSRIEQVTSSEEIQKRIANWSDDFGQFRERRRKLWSKINEFLDPFQYMLEKTSSPLSQTAFALPACVVVDVVVNVIKACQDVSSCYDQLERMFLHLQRFSARLELYQNRSNAIEEPLRKPVIDMLRLMLKVLGRSEYLIRKGRKKLAIRNFFWGEDAKTKELLQELEQSYAFEKGDVMAVNYQRGRKIEENTETVSRLLERSESHNEMDRLRLQLIGDTSANQNIKKIYQKYLADLAENTAAWLEEEPLFQDWRAGRNSLLWLVGQAGMGKSCIATALIRDLENGELANKAPTAYFFIKEDDKELRDINTLLKTIAWQLQNQDLSYHKHLIEIFSNGAEIDQPDQTWKTLFLSYYRSEKKEHSATVIIDGLDEADETRTCLLRLVAGSQSERTSPSLRFIILGRPEMFYSEPYGNLRLNPGLIRSRINVVQSKNKEAMEQYVRKRISRMTILQRLHRSQGRTVASKKGSNWGVKIIRVAKGVFLFAKLLLDQIEHAGSLNEIEMAVSSPPSGLSQMIERLFKRLEDDPVVIQNKETFRLILLHTTYSRRTILAGEVDVLINATKQETGMTLWEYLTTKFRSIFDLNDLKDGGEEEQEEEDGEDAEYADEFKSALNSTGSLDLDFSGEWDEGDESEEESEESELEIEFEDEDEDADSGVEDLESEHDTPKEWAFDTELTAHQIKTPLSFSHQLILEAIRQEGNQKTISFLPEAESVEIEMAINCLRILRVTLPAADEWRFLAEYPLRNLAFHLNAAYCNSGVTSSQRQDLIEGLYWLFGTEAGADSLLRASENLDMTQFEELFKRSEKDGKKEKRDGFWKQEVWSRQSFWDSWVATDENIFIVQRWLATFDEATWKGRLKAPALSWAKAASTSLAEFLRCIMKAAVKMSFSCPDYGHISLISDHSWGVSLAEGWLTMIESGPLSKWSSIDFEKLLRRMQPERVERLAAYLGKPLDSTGLFFAGIFMIPGHHYHAALDYFTQAADMDSQNWRAHEFMALMYSIEPHNDFPRAVVRQALANSLCKEHPKLEFLFSESSEAMLSQKLGYFVDAAIGQSDFFVRLIEATNELDGDEYRVRAMTYLVKTQPDVAQVLENSHQQHSKNDIQFLANVIETLLASKTGNNDAFIQAQTLYELSGQLTSETNSQGSGWLAEALDSMAMTLKGTEKELMYKTWASVYSTRVYLDRALLAATPDSQASSLLELSSLAQSTLDTYQGSRKQKEYLHLLLPSLSLRLCCAQGTGQPHTTSPRDMAGPWISAQISSLENTHGQDRKVKNSQLLVLSKVLNLVGESDGEVLYTVLLGYALLCCGEIDVVSVEPEQGSIEFDVSGIMPFCDGLRDNCRPDITNCAELWRCEVCADRHWCGECVFKVRNEGDGKLCHSKHVFQKIWPMPSDRYRQAVLWYQNKAWIQRNWWEQFKAKWVDFSSSGG